MSKKDLKNEALSKCELQVAKLVLTGISNKAAADQLHLSEKTVKYHLTKVYKTLGIKSRAMLIATFEA